LILSFELILYRWKPEYPGENHLESHIGFGVQYAILS